MTTDRRSNLFPAGRATLAGVAVVAALSLGACGSSDESSADTTNAQSAPAPATDAATVPPAATEAPTTEAPTTEAPSTEAPTTEAPTTEVAGPTVISITVGTDDGPDRIEQVAVGTEVTLQITNPAADDEFHLHGYDLGDGQEVPAGTTATFTFVADEAGTFELESHETDAVLMVLEVG